jgi:hypothetical protein
MTRGRDNYNSYFTGQEIEDLKGSLPVKGYSLGRQNLHHLFYFNVSFELKHYSI